MNKLNLTGKFIEREFNLTLSDKIKDIKLRKLLNFHEKCFKKNGKLPLGAFLGRLEA